MGTRFDPIETTVSGVHDAMRSGTVTAEELVGRYLDRIEAYDRANAGINSVVTVNADAKARARELDERLASDGLGGPLHGIPVVVKDQAMTAGLRTTFGSEAFGSYVPDTDATIVGDLKRAGAIILAKTAMNDWAAGSSGLSSILGRTKNPYALDRDPGGSSSGTGAAVAANFGTVGIGEDTGGSIRAPSSSCNLFGIRVTTGLVSRTGFSPLVTRQDTPGPMARTVEDMVRLLDVIVGFDPADPYTGRNEIADTTSYLDALDEDALAGARIGVLREAFGSDDDEASAPVNRVVETALGHLDEAGSELVDPVSIPDLETRLEETSLYGFQSRHDITAFLGELDDAPISSFDELYRRGAYHPELSIDKIADGPADPFELVEYWEAVEAQREFRHAILAVFAEHDLDAMAFPDTKVVPRHHADLPGDESGENYLINTFIASQSSCPAVSMPAGFTETGLPVGIELVGPPYSERRLLSLAADYESHADTRKPPTTAPPLE